VSLYGKTLPQESELSKQIASDFQLIFDAVESKSYGVSFETRMQAAYTLINILLDKNYYSDLAPNCTIYAEKEKEDN